MVIVASILSIFLLIVYCIQILYFARGWAALKQHHEQHPDQNVTVSVMIPVRNESENIRAILHDLVEQDYPRELLEIIVIDDHSTDDTAEKVRSMNIPNLKLISLTIDQPFNSYKKKAISVAIEHSRSELIISTDGDCRMGKQWISRIVSFYKKNDLKMISSPVSFYQERSLFERLQTVEFQFLIGIGAASIRNGSPTTCNGANLAYQRQAFIDVDGFAGIDHFASGDDELLLYKMNRRFPGKVGFLKDREAIVYTRAKATFSEFVQQRKRWASKSVSYEDKKIIALVVMIYLFNLSLLLNGIAALFNEQMVTIFYYQLIMKFFVDGIFVFRILQFFRKSWMIIYLPLVEFFYVFYILLIGILGNFGKTYEWKGRQVR